MSDEGARKRPLMAGRSSDGEDVDHRLPGIGSDTTDPIGGQ
jgi:hypothetical protein